MRSLEARVTVGHRRQFAGHCRAAPRQLLSPLIVPIINYRTVDDAAARVNTVSV